MRIYDLLSSVGHWAHYRLLLCASADPRPTRSDGIEDLLCVNHACESSSSTSPRFHATIVTIYLSFPLALGLIAIDVDRDAEPSRDSWETR